MNELNKIKITVDLMEITEIGSHAITKKAIGLAKKELMSNITKISDLVSPLGNIYISFAGEMNPNVTMNVNVKELKDKISNAVNSARMSESELNAICKRLYPEFSDDMFSRTMLMYLHVDNSVSKEEFLSFVLREE